MTTNSHCIGPPLPGKVVMPQRWQEAGMSAQGNRPVIDIGEP